MPGYRLHRSEVRHPGQFVITQAAIIDGQAAEVASEMIAHLAMTVHGTDGEFAGFGLAIM